MPVLNCLCGARIEADREALVEAYWAHADTAHPGLPISQRRRDNATEAIRRSGGWDGVARTLAADIHVRPLSPELKDDYLAFFDGPAFSDNPAWASCYCVSYQMDMDPALFDERTAAENRATKAEMIDRGQASGVLAYAGGEVVGWCHAAPRTTLPQLDRTAGFESDDPERTAAIVCFVVPPAHRGQGLSRKLLDGACTMMRERGFAWLDVYPPKSVRSAAGGYHGSRRMYEDAGFEHVREAGNYVVMRRAL